LDGNTYSDNGYQACLVDGARTSAQAVALLDDAIPYAVDGIYAVGANADVTIAAGTTVKFIDGWLDVSGDASIVGTAIDPIIFTTIDDNVHGGDTSDIAVANPVYWRNKGIQLHAGSDVEMTQVEVWYGNTLTGEHSALYIDGCSPTLSAVEIRSAECVGICVTGWSAQPQITQSTVFASGETGVVFTRGAYGTLYESVVSGNGDNGVEVELAATPDVKDCTIATNGTTGPSFPMLNDGNGILAEDADPLISGNVISDNLGYAVFVGGNAEARIGENIAENNYADGIALGGYRDRQSVYSLPKRAIPYIIPTGFVIDQGSGVAFAPGTVVKFQNRNVLELYGGLLAAVGTAENPIIFTDISDDSTGEDTLNDGAQSPSGTDGLILFDHAAATGQLEHVVVRKLGDWTHPGTTPAIMVDAGQVTIANAEIVENCGPGVEVWGDSAFCSLTNVKLERNVAAGISLGVGASASLQSCSASQNGSNGIRVTSAGSSYTATSTLDVADCSVSSNVSAGISIEQLVTGSLTDVDIEGNGGDGIVTASTGPGEPWGGLGIGTETPPFALTDVRITSNEGNGLACGAGNLDGQDCTLSDNGADGIAVTESGSVTLGESEVSGNAGNGVSATSGSVTLTDCDILDNEADGMCVDDADAVATLSLFRGNDGYQVSSASGATPEIRFVDLMGTEQHLFAADEDSKILATYCYWGSNGGPTPEDRDSVVTYFPWSRTPCRDSKGSWVFGGNTPCGAEFEPVNTSTGNYYFSRMDISVPGKGLPLEFSRTYNNQDNTNNGALGYGWTNNMDTYLRFDPDDAITALYGDGRRVQFTPDGASGYETASERRERLVANEDGTYEIVFVDQGRYEFNENGRVTTQLDRYGNSLEFDYGDANESLVSTVTASDGRYLALQYTGSRISTITDSAGRAASYAYDAAG
ncbi:MAG: right-handed parallel beta-helix repeat-containing protein, partial [Coriobacteriia bacterium]|nr:right-handed parallel beta-helix repeat-containing protein [Coriobacteriia bacterium]